MRVCSCYAGNERSAWREFLDAPVASVGDQNVAVEINRNSSRGIKFPLSDAFAAFKHISHTSRYCAGCDLNRSTRQFAHLFLELANIVVRNLQYVKRPYSAAKGI